jgi:hypothetical protein
MKRHNGGAGFYDRRIPVVASEPNLCLSERAINPIVALTPRKHGLMRLLGRLARRRRSDNRGE